MAPSALSIYISYPDLVLKRKKIIKVPEKTGAFSDFFSPDDPGSIGYLF
jgi:hypothetical protein